MYHLVQEYKMTLLPEERKTFFKNWLGLLAFVNDKYNLVEDFNHPKSPVGINLDSVMKIKTKLWKNVKIIDEYIDSVRDLPQNDIQILRGWKKKIKGSFIIVRHLKKHSVFMNDKNNLLYGVIGISCPIYEIIPTDMLPTYVDTVLLPFGDKIIYDSLFSAHNVQFGPNMRRDFNERYMEIKKGKGIIGSLG
jgi:hypothetical protein